MRELKYCYVAVDGERVSFRDSELKQANAAAQLEADRTGAAVKRSNWADNGYSLFYPAVKR
jgi:poly-gamma-glutamate capsule biosynthesis protein CapA/YwtB (metallophosphatase superfamily)